jgi:hypothetical protein
MSKIEFKHFVIIFIAKPSACDKRLNQQPAIRKSGACDWPVGTQSKPSSNTMKSKSNPWVRAVKVLPYAAAFATLNAPSANAADYPTTILGDSPVAYYRLEETSGTTAADATANHFDALYAFDLDTNGVPDYPQLGLPGIDTNSILFRLYNDNTSTRHYGFVQIPFHPELSPTTGDGQHGAPFSAECWVQANTQPADYSIPLGMFGKYEAGAPYGNASGWNFYQSPGPASIWIFNMKNGPFAQAAGVPVQLLQWYHLAATFDGSTVVFYINGVAQVTSSGNTAYLADHAWDGQIGAGDNTGFLPFNGGVDEVAFYTNVLSASQILNHYQVGTNSFRAVPTPPGFLEQPASRTNYSGTTASFTVVANGTLPLHFQWNRGGLPIAGATGSSYSFVCHYPADDGALFSVTVTNSVGSSNSAMATLTVLTNLVISHDPFGPITRNIGSKAAFRVVADGAQPITYQWFKGAASIPGATSDTLWLNNVQLADAVNYHAHVTGPFQATDSATAALVVQPRTVNVPVEGYARIVVGDDPVAYWRLDETNGTVATDAVGSFDGAYTGGGTLTFGVPTGIPHETNDPAINITAGAVVSIPYALELNPVTGPWSAESWVKPGSQNPDQFRTVFSSMWNSDFGGHLFGWNVYQHVQSYWTLNMFNGGGGGSFTSEFNDHPLSTNTWYHMVITDDLTNIRYYVNGVLGVTLSRAGFGFIPNGINGDVTVAGAPTVLGQRSDNAFDPFDGSVDDSAFYNYALSQQQILNHYLGNTRLTITRIGNNAVVSWAGSGFTLQSSPNVYGSNFVNVVGATSPYTNAITGAPRYFRLQLQ